MTQTRLLRKKLSLSTKSRPKKQAESEPESLTDFMHLINQSKKDKKPRFHQITNCANPVIKTAVPVINDPITQAHKKLIICLDNFSTKQKLTLFSSWLFLKVGCTYVCKKKMMKIDKNIKYNIFCYSK